MLQSQYAYGLTARNATSVDINEMNVLVANVVVVYVVVVNVVVVDVAEMNGDGDKYWKDEYLLWTIYVSQSKTLDKCLWRSTVRRLGIYNRVGFLPCSCLQVDRQKQANTNNMYQRVM